MTESAPANPKPIALEELIALNEELASLVRAGVPLQVGMAGLSAAYPGRLGELTNRLVHHMTQGASLSDALAAERDRLPRVYHAVVEAGLKTGRLPEALEALSGFAQSLLEIRRRVQLALIYPIAVLVLAYLLFLFFIQFIVPRFEEMYATFRLEVGGGMAALRVLHESLPYWAAGLPALIVLLLLGALIGRVLNNLVTSGDAARNGGQRVGLEAGIRWLPGSKRLMANFHRATFSHLSALLVEHHVPLHDALALAAETTGNADLIHRVDAVADDLRRGQSLSQSLQARPVFPPFMQWMLSTGERQGALAAALRQLTEIYRRRAIFQAEWLKVVLPVLLVVLIGGGATLLYALTLFIPLTELLGGLIQEPKF